MIHPNTELRKVSETIGYGVFATQFIPRGTIVWTSCHFDMVFTQAEIMAMSLEYQAIAKKYMYLDEEGCFNLNWDHARFINHSCNANTCSVDYSEVAICDIAIGDQITCDYSGLNIPQGFTCHCGATNCRQFVQASDLLTLAANLDQQIQTMLPIMATVPQPLYPFIKDKARFNAILKQELAVSPMKERLLDNREILWQITR